MTATIQIGLDRFLENPPASVLNRRLGLLCNPASVNVSFVHARFLIQRRFGSQLTALFSPQHGFHSEKQDNMIESADSFDPQIGIPIFSLYGKTRIPTEQMFELIDTLLVDLQDVGTRVYTFIYTLSYCMELAKKMGKAVIVLDRPNPISGSAVEGNCLSMDCASFVGRFPFPMRHGMTIGELARLFNFAYGIGCDLTVIPMGGWRREMYFKDTGLPWVAPSPNLPTPTSAIVYPGQVIWEGTNVSEGRGTTQPFEFFGAPFIDPEAIRDYTAKKDIPGATLRTVGFEPTSNKWQGHLCRGFQIHVTDTDHFEPYRTSLLLLQAVIASHKEAFEWKKPPYEYEFDRLPIDLIIGDKSLRERLEKHEDIDDLKASWMTGRYAFLEQRKAFLLY
jgi:uncharacterized protein YbbC (DUF1343 family)